MTPYYQDSSVTIYNCDCFDILDEIQECDIVITDPPYGISYSSSWKKNKDRRLGGIYGDTEFPMRIFNIKFRMAMFVFCRWEQLKIIPLPKSFIVWDKGNHSMGDLSHEFGRGWEGCAFYPGEYHEFTGRPSDVIRCPRVNPSCLVHPTEKPVSLIGKIISHHGKSETVFDPFMGSGTTLRAAKDFGKKAIGIEISEKYCEIAAKRMSQEVLFK